MNIFLFYFFSTLFFKYLKKINKNYFVRFFEIRFFEKAILNERRKKTFSIVIFFTDQQLQTSVTV